MDNNETMKLYGERLNRFNSAIALQPTDRVPLAPFFSCYPERLNGGSYKDFFYDHEKTIESTVKFYQKYPLIDAAAAPLLNSGKTMELLKMRTLDWPGRPGTKVSDYSTHQVIEMEPMSQEEYPEMLGDFTGFMIRKYIPRVYPGLKALAGFDLNVAGAGISPAVLLQSMLSPEMLEAYKLLEQISAEEAKVTDYTMKLTGALAQVGFPTIMTGMSEAPYDILGDYFRGTMGIFEDLIDPDMQEYMEQACEMFAQQQIRQLSYLKNIPLPYKRVFFPLHKGMDGFMNEEQYERLYWKPLKKIILALIDMDVTPYIYTEGKYDTRLDFLTDVPKGKVYYHFEAVDMKRAKEKLAGIACISGNLPMALLEFGKKEAVINSTRQLLEDCAPGGGYVFDFDGSLENAKDENVDAMFETLEKYGKY